MGGTWRQHVLRAGSTAIVAVRIESPPLIDIQISDEGDAHACAQVRLSSNVLVLPHGIYCADCVPRSRAEGPSCAESYHVPPASWLRPRFEDQINIAKRM